MSVFDPSSRVDLPPVGAVDALPAHALPAFLTHLAALQARAAVRLATLVVHVPELPPMAPHPEHRDLLGGRDAARMLSISLSALRRLETAGMIPSVRLGRRVLFRRETLLRFAADHETLRV